MCCIVFCHIDRKTQINQHMNNRNLIQYCHINLLIVVDLIVGR